jgi:hypothetical protein
MNNARLRNAILQGCADPWAASVLWKSSPSPPPAPDYAGAAIATAAGNLEATRAATQANRINQYTPYGSLTYAQDPNAATPDMGWSQTVNLSPTGQKLLDYQNNASLGLGQQTGQALDRVDQSLSKPFDAGSVQQIADKAYGAYTSRLDPQWQAAGESMDAKLANQGLQPGTQAYDNAMREFNNAKNDAYQQANIASINTMPQTYQLASATREQPLNELNALRTGSQVQNPTFQAVPQQQTTTGANMLGAAQATGQYNQGLYNQQQAGANSFTNGLFSLGSAAIPMLF